MRIRRATVGGAPLRNLTGLVASSRCLALGLVLTLSVVPLVVNRSTAEASTVPATVAATNWSTMANTVNTAGGGTPAGSVSCVTSVYCVAVSGFAGWGDGGHDYAELWNGTTWSPMSLPSVSGSASTFLIGVSCVTTSFCVAVGQATGPKVLIEQWNGTAWSVVTTSIGEATQLYSVSCLSMTFCEAVGDTGGGQVGPPIAAQWNGSTWSAQPINLPADKTSGSLVSTSCTTPSFCMAVGNAYYQDNDDTQIAYSWNGSSWTESAISAVSESFYPYSVSCAGLTFCAAVGGNPGPVNEVAVWNGSTWSNAQNVPNPASGGQLYGISCFSATSCTAVGASGSNSESLSWDGQSWTQGTNTPTGVAGSARATLLGVDCVTDWACVAAGASVFPVNPLLNNYQPLFAMAPIARSGYRFVASDGGVFNYGARAPFLGSMGGTHLNAPIVGMAVMPGGDGYYLVASDGGIFNFGSAQFYGSAGALHLNKPIVGMAVTADGAGYWLVASDGGIFSYGDAAFHGSTGALTLNKPIVGMAPTINGLGYYLVASDGGIFNYGNATFAGSMGGTPLNKPVVGIAVPVSGGYYLVASDGGIFSFPTGAGGPPFYGSTGALTLNKPIVSMTAVAGGYYLSGTDGGVFAFPTGGGGLPFYGSTGSIELNKPIVGIAG